MMIYTTLCAAMIYQACGLDKHKRAPLLGGFLVEGETGIRSRSRGVAFALAKAPLPRSGSALTATGSHSLPTRSHPHRSNPSTKKSTALAVLFFVGGEMGIRTPERLTTVTRFPVARLRPAQPSLRTEVEGEYTTKKGFCQYLFFTFFILFLQVNSQSKCNSAI